MSKVFVSYKREDGAVVGHLVEALRAQGLDVWWDRDIPPDAPWETTIEAQLSSAPVVIVAWSQAAVSSENVKAEARWARRQGRLLQVFLDACEPPLFFGERQGVDLKGWSGAASDPSFRRLLSAVREASRTHALAALSSADPGATGATPAGATTPTPDASGFLPSGTILNGRFAVRRMLVHGGVAAIYEGVAIATGQRVAIKAFRPEIADLPVMEAFLRDMSSLTRQRHPAIVPYLVVAQDPANGLLYLVSEFIDGIPLDVLIGQVTVLEPQLVALLRRLAAGLQHAHGLGVIHGALTPDNILAPNGRLNECRIVDLGVFLGVDAGEAVSGGLLQRYAAPELRGEFADGIGPWTDVYSLGLIILALATGVRPDAGPAPAPDLSLAPPPLKPLLAAMLTLDPKRRLPSMTDVLSMIDRDFGGDRDAN